MNETLTTHKRSNDMSLQHAQVKLKGTRPLLINVFKPEMLSSERKTLTGSAGNNPDEWKNSYTANENGQLYLDPSYIFATMREAARYTRIGRSSIQNKVAATLQVLTKRIYFDRYIPDEITQNENESVYMDVRGVRNPNTGSKNVRYRIALSPYWETEFEILWDNTIVANAQIKAVLYDAGILVGLADGRSIGFGRFEIESFQSQSYKNFKKNA